MIIIALVAILSVFLLLSRRKLGFFVMALFTGYVVDIFCNQQIVNLLAAANLRIPNTTLNGVVAISTILGFGLLALVRSGKQSKWLVSIIHSIIVGLFTILLTGKFLQKVFVLDQISIHILTVIGAYLNYIVLGGAVYSIIFWSNSTIDKAHKK